MQNLLILGIFLMFIGLVIIFYLFLKPKTTFLKSKTTKFMEQMKMDFTPQQKMDYDNGFFCKCCGAYNKRYRRKFNTNMATALIALYNNLGGDYVHLETYLASKGLKRCGDASYLRFYNFIEKKEGKRDDGSAKNGFYRITQTGCLFVEKKITAKEFFLILHNRLEGFSGRELYVNQVPKFNYSELMEKE